MTVLLQVSDPHFGSERAHVIEALERLAHALRPDVLLVSGDITQRATRRQFDDARAFIDRLAAPVRVVIAGNHDIPLLNLPLRLTNPYGRFRAAFGADLQPMHESGEMIVVGVKTTRRWRHADGQVSRAQIDRVCRLFDRGGVTDRRLRVVLVHQPVAVTTPEDRHNLLHGHEQALRPWSEAGADLVVGGHIHLPFVVPLQGCHDVTKPLWAVQAGTAVSSRVRRGAGNSVNVIRASPLDPGRPCVVERWDHLARSGEFERVGSDTLILRDAGAVAAHEP